MLLRIRRVLRAIGLALAGACAAYLVLLAYPQPLFAHALQDGAITVHSTTPIPDAMRATMARANARLARSPLVDASRTTHVFLCDRPALFALFARQNYGVGGVADWLVGQHVFLRESDALNDRLISPSGTPVGADRPLSYFIAHEVMHIAVVRRIGRWRYSRLPQWIDDGYADFVARDIDIAAARRKLRDNARELDPRRSGLYLRYQLLVDHLLRARGLAIDQVLRDPPDRAALERAVLDVP